MFTKYYEEAHYSIEKYSLCIYKNIFVVLAIVHFEYKNSYKNALFIFPVIASWNCSIQKRIPSTIENKYCAHCKCQKSWLTYLYISIFVLKEKVT